MKSQMIKGNVMVQAASAPSEKVKLKRAYKKGHYDKETIYKILDAQPVCSIAFCKNEMPYNVPTLQWRQGNVLYWHGSSASHAMKAQSGMDVCVNVTILDGFVMARSGFYHSVNFRSVTLYGKAMKVEEKDQKKQALIAMIENLFPGRNETLRPIKDKELKATTLLCMPIEEASAKIRTGPPVDDDEDYKLPIWAGIISVKTASGMPESDEKLVQGIPVPRSYSKLSL